MCETFVERRAVSDTVRLRGAAFSCVAVLGGALALAGCSQSDHRIARALATCDQLTLADYAGTWRLTLPSTLTGSTFTHCTDPASDGTAITVPTGTPCPENPTSPCPVVLTFTITIFLKDYQPGGVPRYGFSGTTDAGQYILGEIDHATCTASFSFGQDGGVGFGCLGTVAENHREMFGLCAKGTIPVDGQGQGSTCDVAPPIEPLIEFLPPEPAM